MTLMLMLNILTAITVIIIIAIVTYIKKRAIACKWAVHGCKQQHKRSVLAVHEDKCWYRMINCPALHRGSCLWRGSVAKLLIHGREKPCIQVLRGENRDVPFKSFIGDYREPEMTVFNQARVIYWKPILLVGQGVSGYLVYITVHRTPAGIWFITPRSYSPERIIQRMEVEIEVFQSGARNSQTYVYEGGLTSSQLSDKEAKTAGKFMTLSDGQVKMLSTENNIFEFNINVIPVSLQRET